MSPSSDSLCPQCAKIDFTFFTKSSGLPQFDAGFRPRLSWSTLLPEQCSFCQLLLHCISDCQGINKPFEGTIYAQFKSRELRFYIEDGGAQRTGRKLDYSIQRCQTPPLSPLIEELRRSTYFDVNELKLWLDACEVHQCLPADISQHSLPEDFRLIDVENECIVQTQDHIQYCALSYVWGDVQQPLLTSANRLESPNSLKALDLPKTILDAMALCRDIGCRYLWVDSLCIVQDSKNDKHHQISSMADVYSLSFLAIAACAGDDANAGLAPYGKPRRYSAISSLIRSNSNGSFVASWSPQVAAQEIVESVWASRGWTLQEYALSRRVLFFTGEYVFLRCEKGLWCEDFGLGFSNCFEMGRKWDLPLPRFYRRTPDPDRHYSSTFSQLLSQFVRRVLRYEEDILAAFTGILTRMEENIGPHLWGLPSKEIGSALQWTTHRPFPGIERVGFPSWSWAGWIHDRHDPTFIFEAYFDMYTGFDQRSTNISVLTCYAVKDDQSIYTVEVCDIEQNLFRLKKASDTHQSSFRIDAAEINHLKVGLIQYFPPQPIIELSAYLALQTPSKPPLSHHLFPWASCSRVYIGRTMSTVNGMFPILIKEGGPIKGHIHLKPEWRESEPDFMELFVSTIGLYRTNDSDALQVKCRVVLIKLLHDTKPPVYRRIQVSQYPVCFNDWKLIKPKSRLIALV
ncbi:heterokaryon incompatibility protein-domain-containing protein [Hyaloscypha sp. PMI_1271]|nr:heterokaryon incompatibility protein-domain-containing protein [Hyaloscypha sp. PMI_1271]